MLTRPTDAELDEMYDRGYQDGYDAGAEMMAQSLGVEP
jgi:hypothetical protein